MKKRVLAGIMMAVLMMASVMSVSAAKSKSDEVSVTGASAGTHVADLIFDVDDSVKAVIDEINDGKFTSLSADIQKQLAGKKLVADVVDLQHTDNAGTCNHEVEITVTSLTDKCSDVVLLHYDKVAGAWEVIKPISVKGDVIVAKFDNLSPVAVFANVAEGGSTGTSPSTVGTSSAWMLLVAVAIVALGTGVVATQKKSR